MIMRIIDLLLLLLLMPILFPLFIIICILAIFFHSRNIFFMQTRIGKNYETFKLIKFRSMIVGAQDIGTGLYSYSDDNRITKFGRFLRTTSLDELPQLFNILRGDMSFIGPRPAVVGELELEKNLPQNFTKRFVIKPGLTGWAQIHGRDNLNWPQKIKYDIEFVETKGVNKILMILYIFFYTPIYLLKFSETYEKKQ